MKLALFDLINLMVINKIEIGNYDQGKRKN